MPMRGDRSASKGRRRRAAAEQRRAEQQDWTDVLDEREEDVYVTPPRQPVSRRQLRRANRRSAYEDRLDEDDEDIDIAFAISVSLIELGNGSNATDLIGLSGSSLPDMSYESLVMLEDVKTTAPLELVNGLTGHIFKKESNSLSVDCMEELCAICQVEYKDEDSCMLLPCSHTFHDTCGSEWFLNHSKLCPVCKHDIIER